VGTRRRDLSVDSVALADLVDRGVKGVTLLCGRQQRAVAGYLAATTASLSRRRRRADPWPARDVQH